MHQRYHDAHWLSQLMRVRRCAFLPIDTDVGKAQTAKLLQHAQPHTLIWASPDVIGGAGLTDLAGLPAGCHPVQIHNPHILPQNAANDQASAKDTSDKSANTKHDHQQLSELVEEWQQQTADKPWLPFCYVMYTSGSTGSPAGVRGTETGWLASPRPH